MWSPKREFHRKINKGIKTANLDSFVYFSECPDNSNTLVDWDLLERCTIGFDAAHLPEGVDRKESFKDYVLGTYEGFSRILNGLMKFVE